VTWSTAHDLDDLVVDVPVGVVVDGTPICLVRTQDEVYAVHDECTHAEVPLSEGEVEGRTIECWMHGSRFDLRTGEALNLPATEPVRTYPVRVVDGQVQVFRA
jgi:3-phenylpropionate/trans-cinnamate dioxygenase ferredoxin subunit